MIFKHDMIPLPSLIRLDGETRYYETPTGQKYPSVTSVIGAMSDKSGLVAWRDRVGNAEANKISRMATQRGTIIHELCEQHMLNTSADLSSHMPMNKIMFTQLRDVLNEKVNDVRVVEGSLFSHKLKVAGSVDLVARFQGKPSVIDFKTSTRAKQLEWIHNYFIQTAMYSFMLWEMTGVYCPQLVVMIAVEEDPWPQIFVSDVSQWLGKAKIMCDDYHKING